ncbi:MAG: glycosyltransferase family 39 protein [Holophagales bacterium]|jgi:4-amino-4-deoxy-L-arabinose transferase-like glycosyltransferase|nr:glycosyltransferase family 39 protein [Holophagales bacterium]
MVDAGWKQWLRENRVPLLFLLIMLLAAPMRGLWAPDEPNFAQCVREMREGGEWLLPYFNGRPYNEKPILFYWAMKCSAILCDKLTGGLGFVNGISAWALRLPSVFAAGVFVFAMRRWAARFADRAYSEICAIVLAATAIWIWQAQFIQIDMLFSVLVAWSWLAWLGGYLLLRGEAAPKHPNEARTWFFMSYASLGLAFLAKGPLAIVLSVPVIAAFILWQRDWKAIRQMSPLWGALILLVVISPWYIAAAVKGGADYAYNLLIYQNFGRALNAWAHVQPWWRYARYIAGDLMPWTLLLPFLAVFLFKGRKQLNSASRFVTLAMVVPVLVLSCSQSKQGKYVLMIYPFIAMAMGQMLHRFANEIAPKVARWINALYATLFGLIGLAALVVVFAGGRVTQMLIPGYRGPVAAISLILLLGAGLFAIGATKRTTRNLVRNMGITVGLLFLVGGTWGFRVLDLQKGYGAWTEKVKPLITGKQVYFWQPNHLRDISAGAMIYTDNMVMPEIRSAEELEKLPAGTYLVASERDWPQDQGGLTDAGRAMFSTAVKMPIGGAGLVLMEKTGANGTS